MIVANGKNNETVPLFTVSNGMTAWWNLRLDVEQVDAAPGAVVAIKVNGASVPDELGEFQASVSPGAYPQRRASRFVLLNDGDVVTARVEGPGTVNLRLSGDVAAEGL